MSFEQSLLKNRENNHPDSMPKAVELPELDYLKLIESASLSPGKKLDVALLLLGKKPATQVGNFQVVDGLSPKEKENIENEFAKEFEAVLEMLDALSLRHSVKQYPQETDGIFGYSILVASDDDALSKTVNADEQGDDAAFGLLMGYPETAVQAYLSGDSFDYDEELPFEDYESLKEEGLMPFLYFMPSKAHWKEEFEYARGNRDLIREKCPKLYTELVDGIE